jgi:hypothetical protein
MIVNIKCGSNVQEGCLKVANEHLSYFLTNSKFKMKHETGRKGDDEKFDIKMH